MPQIKRPDFTFSKSNIIISMTDYKVVSIKMTHGIKMKPIIANFW